MTSKTSQSTFKKLAFAAYTLCFILLSIEAITLFTEFLVFVEKNFTNAEEYRPSIDILYDVSGIALPILTIIAIFVAWSQLNAAEKQLRSAERTSKGETYTDLFASWIWEFEAIKPLTIELSHEFTAYQRDFRASGQQGPLETIQVYISNTFKHWDEDHPHYQTLNRFLIMLESLGIMVRKEYIDMDDAYLFLQGGIQTAFDYYRVLIQSSYDESMATPGEQGVLEHSQWLLAESQGYKLRVTLQPSRGRLY